MFKFIKDCRDKLILKLYTDPENTLNHLMKTKNRRHWELLFPNILKKNDTLYHLFTFLIKIDFASDFYIYRKLLINAICKSDCFYEYNLLFSSVFENQINSSEKIKLFKSLLSKCDESITKKDIINDYVLRHFKCSYINEIYIIIIDEIVENNDFLLARYLYENFPLHKGHKEKIESLVTVAKVLNKKLA